MISKTATIGVMRETRGTNGGCVTMREPAAET
jgi:hypothetical protein